jgi:ribosomal protein L32
MGKPKKRTSPRRTGARRSHLLLELARKVNSKSPVKAFTTRRESGKKVTAEVTAKAAPVAKKAVAKKPIAKKDVKKAA